MPDVAGVDHDGADPRALERLRGGVATPLQPRCAHTNITRLPPPWRRPHRLVAKAVHTALDEEQRGEVLWTPLAMATPMMAPREKPAQVMDLRR